MQIFYLLAGVLVILVGIVHSTLGELLIFNRLREGGIVPTSGGQLLLERNVRILWATWHIVTIFGLAFSAILFNIASNDLTAINTTFLSNTIACAMLISSILVLLATKARHPGWVGLLAVALLCWLA